MVILNWAKKQVGLFIAGSQLEYPQFFMIGSGSGTTLTTQTSLINPTDRQAVTSSNGSTAYKVKWTGDWSSVEISGLNLREFGMCLSGTGTTGSMWSRTGLPTIVFDGTNELRIEESWEIY
jgi:hypothetical protein